MDRQDQGFKQRLQADLEHRIQRSKDLAEKRRESAKPEVDVVAELDKALNALDEGATDFENSFGKANQPLIDATMEVDRLRSELAAAESRLAEIKDRGDSVQRLQRTVSFAESALNGLLSAAEEQAMRKLIEDKFGWVAPMQKVSRETLRELSLDISVQSLREFSLMPNRQQITDQAELQKRLDVIGERLASTSRASRPITRRMISRT